jgi:hypothetical protein
MSLIYRSIPARTGYNRTPHVPGKAAARGPLRFSRELREQTCEQTRLHISTVATLLARHLGRQYLRVDGTAAKNRPSKRASGPRRARLRISCIRPQTARASSQESHRAFVTSRTRL